MADLDFLQVCVSFIRTGELPHHDHGKVEGIEEVGLPAPGDEDRVFRLDDNLHPHDLKHDDVPQRGDGRNGDRA